MQIQKEMYIVLKKTQLIKVFWCVGEKLIIISLYLHVLFKAYKTPATMISYLPIFLSHGASVSQASSWGSQAKQTLSGGRRAFTGG